MGQDTPNPFAALDATIQHIKTGTEKLQAEGPTAKPDKSAKGDAWDALGQHVRDAARELMDSDAAKGTDDASVACAVLGAVIQRIATEGLDFLVADAPTGDVAKAGDGVGNNVRGTLRFLPGPDPERSYKNALLEPARPPLGKAAADALYHATIMPRPAAKADEAAYKALVRGD